MNNTRISGIEMAPRAQRRWMVLLLYLSYLAIGPAYGWLRPLALFPALLCLLSLYALRRFTRRFAVFPFRRRVSDERDERVREHAMARSCQVASGLLLFVFSWLSAAANGVRWWHPATPGEWWFVYWGVMLVVCTLPQAIISWSEPPAHAW